MKNVFITGGTGYIGSRLITALIKRGHSVTALVRKGSENKLSAGVTIIVADPFDDSSFSHTIPASTVFVQLLGVSHPSPKKAALFETIDLRSMKASVNAATQARVDHFVYVSVAMEPSSIMHAYQEVRKQGEAYCLGHQLPATFVRPWYVLGPGHYWPILLTPLYAIAKILPALRKKANALGLVTIQQMIDTLIFAIEATPVSCRIVEVKDIKRVGHSKSGSLT